jgi:ribonucleoside-diphosphate reductase alpha chain
LHATWLLTMTPDYFTAPVSRLVWDTRYRYRDASTIYDKDVAATWRRVARAVAAAEGQAQDSREEAFYELLRDFRFLPGGRIMAGAGTGRRVTLFNCFVMGSIEDSMEGIFSALREGALTMQQGGGVGYDFSTLRPSGCRARAVGGIASGPVSFMRIWDSMCATLMSTGARRGAMMATLRCDHPDILAFIDAKQDSRELRHFNLSVLVTDAFMQAVRCDADWALVFPVSQLEDVASASDNTLLERNWPGHDAPVTCRVIGVLRARELWDRLMRASYAYAEPGVLFIDRINQWNNLWYRERITATNPCGEIPLPPYGACDLGSLNLTRFIEQPFTGNARIRFGSLGDAAHLAVRFLDNVIEISRFPLLQQRNQAMQTRRIGLGITGLADALIMLGIRYGSQESLEMATRVMRTICHAAYRSSVQLAREKGNFPGFNAESHMQGSFVQSLPGDIREAIATTGIRNSHLIAIAPTGTISLLANNVSSGLEPVFEARYRRRIRQLDGSLKDYEVVDNACHLWQNKHGQDTLPPAFIDAQALSPQSHLQMQAAIQPYTDNAISKTINIPEDFDIKDYQSVFEQAYTLGLKGCTTFRPNPVTGSVLSAAAGEGAHPHCCDIDREAD